MELSIDEFVEGLSTSELFSFRKECVDRVEAANKELKSLDIILPALEKEVEVRRADYEVSKDL